MAPKISRRKHQHRDRRHRVGADEQEPVMSQSHSRHAAPDATPTDDITALPRGITLVVLGALAAFYLGGILNPMTNLRHFPIAVVNEDAGPTGAQVVKGLLANFAA